MQIHTLEEAKRYVEEGCIDGVDCPCCGRLAKVYKTKLSSGMTTVLAHMCRESHRHLGGWMTGTRGIQVGEKFTGTNWTLMRHWGLIEPSEEGALWRVTELGFQFIRGEFSVSSAVSLYRDVPVGWSTNMATVHDAMKVHFDFHEFMNATPDVQKEQ